MGGAWLGWGGGGEVQRWVSGWVVWVSRGFWAGVELWFGGSGWELAGWRWGGVGLACFEMDVSLLIDYSFSDLVGSVEDPESYGAEVLGAHVVGDSA